MDLNSFGEKMQEFLYWVLIIGGGISLICILCGSLDIGLMIVVGLFFFIMGLLVMVFVCPEFVLLVGFVLYALFWVCKGAFKGLFKAFVWLKNREYKDFFEEVRTKSREELKRIKEAGEKEREDSNRKFDRVFEKNPTSMLIFSWSVIWGFVFGIGGLVFAYIGFDIAVWFSYVGWVGALVGAVGMHFIWRRHTKIEEIKES